MTLMRPTIAVALALLLLAVACSPRDAAEPSPTATQAPATATSTTSPPTPTATVERSPSPTPTPTPMPTPSPTPAGPTPTPTNTPVPEPIEFEFDEEVPARERALIQLGVLSGQDYAEEVLDGAVVRTVFVQVANTGVCIDGASAIGYKICVNAGTDSWQSLADYLKLKIAAHEYFHVWQHDLFCYREPKWMFEGLAEWFGYEAIIEDGLVERVAASVERQQVLQRDPIHEPLSEQEILYAAPNRPQYALWSFAAQRLMSGIGADELRTFCAGRRDGLEWEEAFEEAFGEPVEAFYEEFEEWRSEFLPYSAVE